eukprot:9344192-Ditylum_brightwellii.AAC.1
MESYQTKDIVLTAEYYQAQEIMENLIELEMDDPLAFTTKHDPDTMHFHQAIKKPDAPQFFEAIVPKGTKILDDVWAMKCKKDIKVRKIAKYKDRLNVHGGQQEYGMNYFDTYAPVVTWSSARLILVMVILNTWVTSCVQDPPHSPHL